MSEKHGDKLTELINKSEIADVVNGYFRALDEKDFDPRHFAATLNMWEGSKTNANNVDNFFVAGGVIDVTLIQIDGRWKISQLSNTVTWRAGGFRNMLQTR
jgi:hypothetical protein